MEANFHASLLLRRESQKQLLLQNQFTFECVIVFSVKHLSQFYVMWFSSGIFCRQRDIYCEIKKLYKKWVYWSNQEYHALILKIIRQYIFDILNNCWT